LFAGGFRVEIRGGILNTAGCMNTKFTVLALLAGLTAMEMRADETNSPFKNDLQKASYAIGANFGARWKMQGVEVDYDAYLKGLKDAMEGGKVLLTEGEIRDVLNNYQQELAAKQQQKRLQVAEKNKKDGEAFLAANKQKPGIVTTPTGLQYKILEGGNGESPKPEDNVSVHYRGTLIDGTEFDSSANNGGVASFRVDGVIRGWTEALSQMKPGAKWQLFIPSDLAYGESGRPPRIEPNATLIFEIELVSVQSAPQRVPLTSDVIKVPSLEEMKKGAKIETIKAEDVEKLQKQEQEKQKPKQK
jgi:FKBP-type peptidyl-prolyl cis-trans isomerase